MNFVIELREDSRTSQHQLSIESRLDGKGSAEKLQVAIDGETLNADWAEISPGAYSILIDGQSYEARVAPASGGAPGPLDAWVVTIGEYDFQVQVRDPRTRRFAGPAAAHDGPLDVLAPMPGKIVRVLVSRDQEVTQDQGLVVIEAMKMQNELRAPRAGRITEVHVREGIGIESGAKLMRLE
jgi:biotin carboxyl carrier protein